MREGDIEDFKSLLHDAELNAETDWEMSFVSDTQVRYSEWGEAAFVSHNQYEVLTRIARR